MSENPEHEMVVVERRGRVRRAGRVVSYTAKVLQSTRLAEDGEPEIMITDELRAENDVAAAQAWLEKFGTPLPPKRRPGRKSEAVRTEVMTIRLHPDEVAALVRLQHEREVPTAAEVLRQLIAEAAGAPEETTSG